MMSEASFDDQGNVYISGEECLSEGLNPRMRVCSQASLVHIGTSAARCE